jgi:hypothetical protein
VIAAAIQEQQQQIEELKQHLAMLQEETRKLGLLLQQHTEASV